MLSRVCLITQSFDHILKFQENIEFKKSELNEISQNVLKTFSLLSNETTKLQSLQATK